MVFPHSPADEADEGAEPSEGGTGARTASGTGVASGTGTDPGTDPGARPGPGRAGVRPALAEWARDLAAKTAAPTTAERDEEARWDPALFAELALAGAADGGAPGVFTGPLTPREYGGAGLTARETVALLQGLGEGSRDPGLALAAVVHAVLATVPLRAFGTPRQREHYLPRMASGEWTGALSLRQTQGAALAPTVTARPATDGPGGWKLTGGLDLVAGAPHAHHFLVVAAHEGGGRTAFLVDRHTPGLRIHATDQAALRTCAWGRLVLDDCPLPEDAVLGTVAGAGQETEPLLAALDWVFSSAPWLGIMRALAADALDAARDRELFGRPIAHAQSARFALADTATRCELAEGLLYGAADRFDGDGGGRPSPQDAAAARLFVAGAARAVTDAAARLSGPLALTGDRLVERAYRDVLFFAETGGGTDVLRPVIAASVLGLG